MNADMTSSNETDHVQTAHVNGMQPKLHVRSNIEKHLYNCQGCGHIAQMVSPMVDLGRQINSSSGATNTNMQHKFQQSVSRRFLSCKMLAVSCESSSGDTLVNERNTKMISRLKEFKMLEEEVEAYIAAESGMDRISRVLTADPVTQFYSPEVVFVKRAALQIMTGFFFFGFITGARDGKKRFLARNKATRYAAKSLANKRMYNAMIQSGMKGSMHWMLKGGSFLIPTLIIERGLAVYYNKTSPVHMMVAFGSMSCLMKIGLGPKGMFAGGVIGSVLGLAFGALWTGICTLMGETQDVVTYNSVRSMIERQRSYRRPVVSEDVIDEEEL